MFSRKLRHSFWVCCWVVGIASQALAQSPAPDPTSAEGKRLEGKARYERGVEAYSAGRFKDAIDLFLQADALAPSAALSFNIARASEKIGDDAACLQWYRDFRRRAPDAKNGPEVDARIHELELQLAKKGVQQLTVLSSPQGATVIIDEQPVGVTPFTGQFPPGAHRVLLTLKGYADSDQQLQLQADHAQDLQVPLVPAADRPPQAGAAANSPTSTPPTTPGPSGQAPADHASGPRFGIWPWIGIGAGAAVLGGSLGFELARRSAEKDAKNDTTQVGYKEKLDREHSRQTAARVLAAVGGALAVTGGALLVVDLSSHSSKPAEHARLGLACLPGSCAFDVRGQF
jgi:tetratricopeptide (TPR) repeat protein